MARRSHEQSDFLANLLSQLGLGLRGLWRLFRGQQGRQFNQQIYRSQWQEIDRLARNQASEQEWKQAIIEADKLVDQAFRDVGLAREKFSDRLRAAEKRFTKSVYNGLWEAHKLRNKIAHEVGCQVTYPEIKHALDNFRAGLNSLGAL